LLLNYKSADIKVIEKCEDNIGIFDFPLVILKAKEEHNNSSNFILGKINGNGLYQITANEYVFFYSLTMESSINKFEFLNNLGINNFIIGLLRNQE